MLNIKSDFLVFCLQDLLHRNQHKSFCQLNSCHYKTNRQKLKNTAPKQGSSFCFRFSKSFYDFRKCIYLSQLAIPCYAFDTKTSRIPVLGKNFSELQKDELYFPILGNKKDSICLRVPKQFKYFLRYSP